MFCPRWSRIWFLWIFRRWIVQPSVLCWFLGRVQAASSLGWLLRFCHTLRSNEVAIARSQKMKWSAFRTVLSSACISPTETWSQRLWRKSMSWYLHYCLGTQAFRLNRYDWVFLLPLFFSMRKLVVLPFKKYCISSFSWFVCCVVRGHCYSWSQLCPAAPVPFYRVHQGAIYNFKRLRDSS